MHEVKIALHIHTKYSDGNANHQELIEIASEAGLDGIFTTDHNILVNGLEGYYDHDYGKVMLMVGEEVHDRYLQPPGNHLLVLGTGQEMSPYAADPQRLIDTINRLQGLSFIAHPNEDALERFGELKYPWRKWDIQNFTGIELWNQMSEFKSVSKSLTYVVINAFFPARMSLGPLESTLALWDELISTRNNPIVAVGGCDAHEIIKYFGPIKIKLYPYLHHFKSVTTHLLLPKPLSGDFIIDRKMVLDALRSGHCFVAYDLPFSTKGFRFSVNGSEGQSIMGDQVKAGEGMTFQIKLPKKSPCRLFKDGKLINEWSNREVCTHITTEKGVYRVEAYIPFKGKMRGWIFSNPIYAWL